MGALSPGAGISGAVTKSADSADRKDSQEVQSEQDQPESHPGWKKQRPPATQMEMFDNRLLSESARKRHRLIGQVFETYWLVEYDGSLYIIDQHAAHEKVLFEKNFASLKTREYTSQFISPPIILTLSFRRRTS